MRILHIIPSLGIGGTEKMLYEICKGLKSPAFEHNVISLKFGGKTEQSLKELGIRADLLNSPSQFFAGLFDIPRLFYRLRSSIQEYSPHIVHTWLSRANTIGGIASRSAGITRVISSLRVMEEEKGYHLWAERWNSRWTQVVTVNCTQLQDFAVHHIGISKEKIVLIPNGVDITQFKVDQSVLEVYRRKWGQSGDLIVGTMGRLHKQKGFDLFIKSAQIVLKQFPHCRFLIAGDGPENHTLKKLAQTLGIENRVTFCGWISSSLEFLSLCDIFALTSRWEGMPNVLLEAMSLKKPIVATRVGGAVDLIESEKEGLLVPSENEKECAASILRMLQNPSLRQTLGQQAYDKVQKKFKLPAMIEAYRHLYEFIA